MQRVLVVEDSPDFQLFVKTALSGLSCEADCASTMAEAMEWVRKRPYDLIMLDVNLPDGDGLDFCARLQADEALRKIPVVFLTAKSEVTAKVAGFSAGADDYLVKPIDFLELRARVQSKLAHGKREREAAEVVRKGPFRIYLAQQRTRLADGDVERDIDLAPTEFLLLAHLVRNEGRVLGREQLVTHVWGETAEVSDRIVDKHVSSLRRSLGAWSVHIETVSRLGYRFTLSPRGRKAA